MSNKPDFYENQRKQVNNTLEELLPSKKQRPETLHRAMRYATLGKGKRIRGVLTLESGRLGDEPSSSILETLSACVEMIHAYSLVHDDLPAMDDDDYRRGKPSCHKKFGEDTAILCGDALQTYTFEIMSARLSEHHNYSTIIECIRKTAQAAGHKKLIGGQSEEFELNKESNIGDIKRVYKNKTGALLALPLELGGLVANLSEKIIDNLNQVGHQMGIAFQIQDDLLEKNGNFQQLGKDINSDKESKKNTLAKKIGADQAKEQSKKLIKNSLEILKGLPVNTERIEQIAQFLVERNY